MSTTSTTLPKDTWVLFKLVGDSLIISVEEGSVCYWRIGTDPDTRGHKMEIGDLVTFYEDVYLKSVSSDTQITVTT